MRTRTLAILLIVVALPAFAGGTKIYDRYETARQALLSGSVIDVTKAAGQLATVARGEKQDAIAQRATALASADDLASARSAFAALSNALIAFRAKRATGRPMVVYCSMEKKSWLQPSGPIVNPYVARSMRGCGEIKAQ